MGNKERYYRSYIFLVLGFILGLILGFASASAHTGHEESHDYMGAVVREIGQRELCQPDIVRHHLEKWVGSAHGKSKIHRDEVHQTLLATAGFVGAERCKTALKEVLGDLKYKISCHYVKDKEKRNILCSAE